MGMCDDFIIEYELPTPGLPQRGWQSKCFECFGKRFTLTKEGRLTERVRAIELVGDKVHETGEWKNIDRNYEGEFNFYDMINDVWHEFDVVMIDGNVKLIKPRKQEQCVD